MPKYLHYEVIIPTDNFDTSADILAELEECVHEQFGLMATVAIVLPQTREIVINHDEGSSYCTSLPEHTH